MREDSAATGGYSGATRGYGGAAGGFDSRDPSPLGRNVGGQQQMGGQQQIGGQQHWSSSTGTAAATYLNEYDQHMELRRNQGSAGRASSPVRENRVWDSLMQRRGGAGASPGMQQDWQPQMEQGTGTSSAGMGGAGMGVYY